MTGVLNKVNRLIKHNSDEKWTLQKAYYRRHNPVQKFTSSHPSLKHSLFVEQRVCVREELSE